MAQVFIERKVFVCLINPRETSSAEVAEKEKLKGWR